MLENKIDIKVDSVVYDLDNLKVDRNRLGHGEEKGISGKCLLKYNDDIFLGDTYNEIVESDENYFELDENIGIKFNTIGDIYNEIIEEDNGQYKSEFDGMCHIDYFYIKNLYKINNDGTLSEIANIKFKEAISNLCDANVCIKKDGEENNYSKKTIPFEKIEDANIEKRDNNKLVLCMCDKEFDINNMKVREGFAQVDYPKEEKANENKTQTTAIDADLENLTTEKLEELLEETKKQNENKSNELKIIEQNKRDRILEELKQALVEGQKLDKKIAKAQENYKGEIHE